MFFGILGLTMRTKTAEPHTTDLGLPPLSKDLIDESFERVAGAKKIFGTDVRLLIDAAENYPAWLAAINSARRYILFESYIIHDDDQGEMFADALIAKAAAGVDVKLIYDWLGGFGKTRRKFWRKLSAAGVDVRCYNRPNLLDPLGIFSRDHRKSLVVDGETAFVSGLCVGRAWVGYPEKDIPGWRDTGVQLSGTAVAEVAAGFAEVWAAIGSPLEIDLDPPRSPETFDGPPVRIIRSVPGAAHIYRLDQLLSVAARESIWISDAYFVGVPSFLRSLIDASRDGVDVRILVPQSSDINLIAETTRSTYRSLLLAGVRVFEWNGPMMHAKTAVFDGRYSRVGSTNLNIASWFGNYELDVFIEDERFGREMAEMFIRDMEGSTEIIISEDFVARRRKSRSKRKGGGSVSKATAGALNAATSISTVLTRRAPLGGAESKLLFVVGSVLLALALLFIFFPRAASIPFIILLLMLAIPAILKGIQHSRKAR